MTNEIKIGDTVRVKENLHEPFCLDADLHLEAINIPPHAISQKEWKVTSIQKRRDCAEHIYKLKHNDSYIYNIPEDCVELIQPTKQTEAKKTANDELQEEFARFMSERTSCMLADRIEREHIQRRMRALSQDDFLKDLDPEAHRISTYEVEVNPNFINWTSYEADLAKEIAVKIVGEHVDNRPSAIGEYAAQTAKAVVEHLKKK